MFFPYKKIFQATSLFFIIWTGTSSSSVLNPKKIMHFTNYLMNHHGSYYFEDLLLKNGTNCVAKNMQKPQNTIFSPYSFRKILEVLTIVKENNEDAKNQTWSRLGIPYHSRDGYLEYLSNKKDNKIMTSRTDVFSRYYLKSKEKLLLKTLKHVYVCDDYNAFNPENITDTRSGLSRLASATTSDQIKKPLDLVKIDQNTSYISVNTTYDKNSWGLLCKETYDIMFYDLNGEPTKKVSAFKSEADDTIGYTKQDGHQVFWVPIGSRDKKYSMVIILPAKGTTPESTLKNTAFCNNITHKKPQSLEERLNKGKDYEQQMCFSLTLPKFSIEQKFDLSNCFFSDSDSDSDSDFDSDSDSISDSAVADFPTSLSQKASIKVNEKGIEVTALTAQAEPDDEGPSTNIRVNRPFAYMIVDLENNDSLFTGTVYDPEYAE